MNFLLFFLVLFSFSNAESSTLWDANDSSASNYNPWSLWDCGDWCCEYEDFSNQSIVINEINYNPASSFNQHDSDYEFIELYNNSTQDINMNGWYLSIDHNSCFTFPDVTIQQGNF